MANIQITEDLNTRDDAVPSRTKTRETDASVQLSRPISLSQSTHDVIYNIRDRPAAAVVPQAKVLDDDALSTIDEDPTLEREGDFKDAQKFSGKMLLWLTYQSVGVIYGDIGTSPLYVYSSTFSGPPSYEDLVGVLSLIIWSLFMMVTVKYVLIVLRADNGGEGGTFSTYALLSRYMNITNRDPREASLVKMQRVGSGDLETAGRVVRKSLESSKIARNLLKIMGVLAVSMVISDGLLTPAQSVLGAVQGVEVVNPSISKGAIIGITDAILVFLFMIQPLGITKMSYAFAPVIIVWLGFNAVFGIYNLVKYDATVFRAFNPGYAFTFLVRNGEGGWRQLGGVLLAFTGVEALFADLGAFSRKAIQLSWLCYVFPCLLLAYIGQASYISAHPDAYSNPFFNSAPPGTIYPALIIAVLAAIVASQAIITATFQLLAQAMKLSYFPQLKVVHTSDIFHGQLYIPLCNWLLMVGTVMVASIYNNTTSLGNAYGVCVMFVTFFDTIMVSMTAMFVWRLSPYWVFLPALIIACMDGAYLSSVLTKVPHGAWFTLSLATVVSCVFLLWRYGKEQQWFAEAEDRVPISHFIKVGSPGGKSEGGMTSEEASKASSLNTDPNHRSTMPPLYLDPEHNSILLHRLPGFGIFFDKAGAKTPFVFSQFAQKLAGLPSVMVFAHFRPLEVPSVPAVDENGGDGGRFTVTRLGIPNCYRVVVRHGYNDVVIGENLAEVLYMQIRNLIERDRREAAAAVLVATGAASQSPDEKPLRHRPQPSRTNSHISTLDELVELDKAYSTREIYILGKSSMKIKTEGTPFVRRVLLATFLWIRDNTRTKMANLRLPREKIIEIGFLKEI